MSLNKIFSGDISNPSGGTVTAFRSFAAKTVLVNATNGSAVPSDLAGSGAFQYLRVNSVNTGLEWAVISVASPITQTTGTFGFDQSVALGNNARVAVSKNSGATVGTRRRINLIEGSNITLTITDDSGNEEVDVTIAAALSPGHTLKDDGVSLTQRTGANFTSGASAGNVVWTLTDDAVNNETDITGTLASQAALSILANATNASAAPTALTGSTARHTPTIVDAGTSIAWGFPCELRDNSLADQGDFYAFRALSGTHTTSAATVTTGGANVSWSVNLTTLVPAIDSTSIIANGTVLERAALTGDVTSAQNSNATTIAANAVGNPKLAQMAGATVKGRGFSAGTGDPTDLIGSDIGQILRLFTGVDDSPVIGVYNDYALTAGPLWRINTVGTGDIDLTGLAFAGGNSGVFLRIVRSRNSGSSRLIFRHENAGSLSGNRFLCPNAVDLIIDSPYAVVELQYVGSRWYVMLAGNSSIAAWTAIENTGTGTIQNYDSASAQDIMFSGTSPVLGGLLAGNFVRGDMVAISRQGTGPLIINDNDTGSTSTNRFATVQNKNLKTIDDEATLWVRSDLTAGATVDERWVCLSHRPPFANCDDNGVGDSIRHTGDDWVSFQSSILTASSTSIMTNTTTKTGILQVTVPANGWVIGGLYEIVCECQVSRSGNASAANITFHLDRGTTSTANTGALTISTSSTTFSGSIRFKGHARCTAVGASGSINFFAEYEQSLNGTYTDGNTMSGSGTVDTTTSSTFRLAAQFSAAVAGLNLTAFHGWIRRIF